jgi:hypothetical protein
MSELARLAAEQWADMGRIEQREASLDYLAALARVGGRTRGRSSPPTPSRAQQPGDVVDPTLERRIDEAGLPHRLAQAVKRLVAGASLRVAAAGSGVSHESLRKIASRVFGAPIVDVVAALARERGLAWRARIEAMTGTRGVKVSALALMA